MDHHVKSCGERNPELYRFRCNLLKVSQRLRDEDVKELAYICPEIKSTEGISKGHDLFLELEKKGLINPGNYDYLLDRLLQIAREDLATLLFERILHSSHTALAKLNTMLDRLLKTGRDDLALHLMQWMCRSPHTPRYFIECLKEHLIEGGRKDLAMQLMVSMNCLDLPRRLQSSQQVMQAVYHAKLSTSASHKRALSMLSIPNSPLSIQMSSVLTKYFREVKQSAAMHSDAIFIQWPKLPHKSSGTIGKILSKTLENTFFFADKFHEMMTAITNEETINLERMEMSATSCNSAIDDFNKIHSNTEWNASEREEVLGLRNTRKLPGAIHIQTAVKSIGNICEGLLCGKMIEETEATVSDRLFTLETAMYATWCSVPLYQWMSTITQLAVSSRVDLTKYQDEVLKVATKHREHIVQHHDELSQIIGQDTMRNIDSVLQIHKQESSTHNSEIAPTTTLIHKKFDLGRYIAVSWYAYLLQLVVLACNCSSVNPLEMAIKMSEHHRSFHDSNFKDVLQCSMDIARKVFNAIHIEIERFKSELIQQCSEASTERALLNGLLQPVIVGTDCQR